MAFSTSLSVRDLKDAFWVSKRSKSSNLLHSASFEGSKEFKPFNLNI
jgi:hypothetical protein